MSSFDFNDAEPQRGFGELIPADTIVLVVSHLRPGQEGPGGWLKANKNGDCLMADFEFTVDGGDFDRRKIWGQWITEGQTEGQQKAGNITRSRLRALLESAFGIQPGDDSAAAMQKRQVSGWQTFDGLKFCARVTIEKDKTGQYADKNALVPVTPDDQRYIAPGPQHSFQTAGNAVQGAAKAAGGGTARAVAGGAAKPAWAS